MNVKLWKLVPLFLGSGTCALAYQLIWMRELRLVFGSSTMATSTVLAIFMGGIGFGSVYLGKKSEKYPNPLRLYGYFEIIISLAAVLTPFLIILVEKIYLSTGGSQNLGMPLATLLRICLTTIALSVPTFFMGGTLPAIAKAVTIDIDKGRRDLGILYGANSLGAVIGIWIVLFVLLEVFGSTKTLWASAFLNLLIAFTALIIARGDNCRVEAEFGVSSGKKESASPSEAVKPSITPVGFVYAASALAGFCFFYMELIWYRMLTPLLGGTTYTIGIILAVALTGIAIGSWSYGLRRYTITPSLLRLAVVCGLEALGLAIPFALGDKIAVLASLLRPIGNVGMAGYAVGWIFISMIVILPASIAAGYQFPMLIALKGHGRQNIARETGQVYAWNTIGGIFGSLLGGIILLPMLGAVASWQTNVILLSLLACISIIIAIFICGENLAFSIIPTTIIALTVILILTAWGPTAAWRHTPIGAGRVNLADKSHNEIHDWLNSSRRNIIWEKDGKESALGIDNFNGLAIKVNGKIDGNSKSDAGTQIIGPMIGAILHPNPRKALVIGLGTGSSSGWLAAVESITRVDTVEIEPAMREFAELSSPVNRNVLENEKFNLVFGDAREVILTNTDKYDLIFSEPSNPYRSGIASLYTREFYQAVADSLNPGGYFSQWLQGYEVDTETIKVIYSTLASIFPVVETWETKMHDLIFVCSMEERIYSVNSLRKRIKEEPFRSALLFPEGIIDLEGFLAHYSANSTLARQIAENEINADIVNTDDRMLVEFGFAKSLGKKNIFSINDIRTQAGLRGAAHPHLENGIIDWNRSEDVHTMKYPMYGQLIPENIISSDNNKFREIAFNYYIQGNNNAALRAWQNYGREPFYPFEILLIAESLAEQGNISTADYINQLKRYWPHTADAIMARYYWRTGKIDLAYQLLEEVFLEFRTNPWLQEQVMKNTLYLTAEMSLSDIELAKKLYQLMSEPFCIYILEAFRIRTLLTIAQSIGPQYIAKTIAKLEPLPIWEEYFLETRLTVYKLTGNSLQTKAERDLTEFRKYAAHPFVVDNPIN